MNDKNLLNPKSIKQVIDSLNLLYESGDICSIDVVYVTINGEKMKDLGCLSSKEILNLPSENRTKIMNLVINELKNHPIVK